MKIESEQISMSAQHSDIEAEFRQEALRAWVGESRPNFEGREAAAQAPDILETSPEGSSGTKAKNPQEVQLQILRQMLEHLTGKKIKMIDGEDFEEIQQQAAQDAEQTAKALNPQASGRVGWGVEYDLDEYKYEKEELHFEAGGVVRTADGKEIQFHVELNLSHEFLQEKHIRLRAGDAQKIDPLLVDFEGTASELGSTRYAFDLDADGNAEKIVFPGAGSGFLALDKNQNGLIDNGLELFGPKSGNGFAELAVYDRDGNGWIDESDPVFEKLRVYNKDDQGRDRLVSLRDAGVGAIHLQSQETPYTFWDSQHKLSGELARSGIFLRDNGQAGLVRQVDLYG